MIKIILGPRAVKKINQNTYELFLSDFEQSLKQFTPGQWCEFIDERKGITYFGYVNPHVENNRPCAYIVKKNDISAGNDPFEYIKLQIDRAVHKRKFLYEYGTNARLVYGGADYLPGLIIDSYLNCILVQINTAGMDQFREQLKDFLKTTLKKEVIFLDNKAYRAGEYLPEFNEPVLGHDIEVVENDVNYKILASVMQKIGYYYDHRINRSKARELSHRIKSRKLKGLDLFCYVGSWGLNLLNGNVSEVDFVDQGDFETEISENLKLNKKKDKGTFYRKDVFKYLKELGDKKYDIICSDPPAFCKSKNEAKRAKDGYIKLHTLCLKQLNPDSLFVACSCTHYVDHNDFQSSVEEAAKRAGKNIQLIDIGLQGLDHPIQNTNSKSSYLKYYAYYVE